MATRKRSHSSSKAAADPVTPVSSDHAAHLGSGGDAAIVPVEASEPLPKRPKSDIDIIRARTAKLSAGSTPSEGGNGVGVDDTETPVATATTATDQTTEDDSSPLKMATIMAAKTGGGGGRASKVGKKGRGGFRRDERRDRRSDRDAGAGSEPTTAVTSTGDGPTEGRRPKRKVAVIFGYVGTGYNGSQIQMLGEQGAASANGPVKIDHGVRTIEGELFKAFVKAGCVSEDNSFNPNKVSLERCCRTDSNVHAACNLIALKLILEPAALASESKAPAAAHSSEPLARHINQFLPPEIRVWGVMRVLGAFSPRPMCDSRVYEYSVPTYVFLPPKPGSAIYDRLRGVAGWLPAEGGEVEPEARWWDDRPLDQTFAADLVKRRAHRISPQMVARVRDAVAQFVGVHNFHNYTQGKDFRDRSATRIMRELSVSDPFVVEGTEWISVTLYGQSFMLHQIRKMIAMIILLCRTRTPSQLIPETFGPQRINIPRAPGLGLLLVHPNFGGYNQRVANTNALQQKHEDREPLEFSRWQADIDAFKRDSVYKRMWEDEKGDDSFATWLNYSDVLTGAQLDYLNPKGIIPQAADASPRKRQSSGDASAGDGATGQTRLFGEDEREVISRGGQDVEDEG